MKALATRALLAVACAVFVAPPAAAQLPPFEVLHEFADEGAQPGPLIEASDGNFYGTTSRGGLYDRGTIFRMTRDYRVSIVYEFSGAFDGGSPVGKLLQASDGHLYGATYRNGAYDQGILYRFSLDGEFRILHAFNLALDGRYPTGSLVQGADGLLYGTTSGGGCCAVDERGMAFRSTLDGAITVLHVFSSGESGLPGPFLQTSDGALFVKTRGFGSDDLGAVFRMNSSGVLTLLQRFHQTSGSDMGNISSRTLVQGADGNVYGTNCDTIFRITLQGEFEVLTPFGRRGVCWTSIELTPGADGLLYAAAGGATYVIGLSGDANAIQSDASPGVRHVIQSINGHLYGSAYDARRGQIVRITPRAGHVTKAGATSTAGAGVRVTWSPVPNAASYIVKRREPGGVDTVIASGLQALSFVDGATTKGGRYTYVVTAVNVFGEGIASHDVSIVAGRATAGDFDGDGVTDPAIFRPSTSEWHIAHASSVVTWGSAGDVPVAADYDGDGIVDIAVFRPSTGVWYIRGVGTIAWGGNGDIPVPGYYRGGNAVDLAVYRPSTGNWYIRGLGTIAWGGGPGDRPVPGDYDGDGRTDLAVRRLTSVVDDAWYIRYANGGGQYQPGCCGSQPTPADYDGDGRTDRSVFSPSSGSWYAIRSSAGESSIVWGGPTDVPTPADYNGDGLTDIAVFRESTGDWYALLSGSSTSRQTALQFRWGGWGDIPVQKAP